MKLENGMKRIEFTFTEDGKLILASNKEEITEEDRIAIYKYLFGDKKQ